MKKASELAKKMEGLKSASKLGGAVGAVVGGKKAAKAGAKLGAAAGRVAKGFMLDGKKMIEDRGRWKESRNKGSVSEGKRTLPKEVRGKGKPKKVKYSSTKFY